MSKEKKVKIIFYNVNFNAFKTYFENIKYPEEHKKNSDFIDLVIIFRHCELKDVYFTDSDMSLFSFYKSIFEEARYYSCMWEAEKRIFEERIFNYINNLSSDVEKLEIKENFKITDLNEYSEIAALYRRFKTLLDKSKDYSEAGGFYFNEIEMKRKHLKNKSKIYYCIYTLYKKFMGYGEKPLLSSLWFLFFLFIFFPFIYLFSGLKISSGKYINYDLTWNFPIFTSTFWSDWWTAVKCTLSRFLPSTYLPEQWANISSTSLGILSFLNSFILILFIVFIGIGLKRHFKRF